MRPPEDLVGLGDGGGELDRRPGVRQHDRRTWRVSASSSMTSTRTPRRHEPEAGPIRFRDERSRWGRSASVDSRAGQGKSTVKVDPVPGPALSAVIVPPCSSTRWRAMASPRPSPRRAESCESPWRKPIEDEGYEVRGDAGAVVLHHDRHALVPPADPHRDVPAATGELDGVGEQVPEHLLEAVGVPWMGRRPRRARARSRRPSPARRAGRPPARPRSPGRDRPAGRRGAACR